MLREDKQVVETIMMRRHRKESCVEIVDLQKLMPVRLAPFVPISDRSIIHSYIK